MAMAMAMAITTNNDGGGSFAVWYDQVRSGPLVLAAFTL